MRTLISQKHDLHPGLRRFYQTFIVACALVFSMNLHAQDSCIENSSEESRYQKIVSVGGAITETIYALGQGDRIVATDTTSYFPPEAENTPKVGYQRALSVEGILSTQADLVIASDHAGPEKVIQQLKTTHLSFVTLPTADSIQQVIDNIQSLGALLCAEQQSRDLVNKIRNKQLAFTRSDALSKQRVLFVMQHSGGAPMVAGAATSAASIIQLSGASNAVTEFEGYKPLTPEALLLAKPDVILTTDFGRQQTDALTAILALPGMNLTPAGRKKLIVSMDSLLLLGFGPRTVEAAQTLHQKLSSIL